MQCYNYACVQWYTFTERMPTAQVSLYMGLSQEEFGSDSADFTVLEGQEFGLVCKTEPKFTANWFTINANSSECINGSLLV